MRYSFRQLEVFLAAAHHENITRAAESLAMSQSAASSALKELESQFDFQLFDRVGKRLQLNDLGRSLRPKVESLMEHGEELEALFQQRRTLGEIKVGATMTIGNYIAVGLAAEFMEQHPETRVELVVVNMSTVAKKVLNFELDVGLLEGEIQHPDLDILPWREDELVVFAHPDHPLAKKTEVSEQDLIEAQWIVREPGSAMRQAFERSMHGILPQLNIRLELQHIEAIKRAVEAQLGIGCLSNISLVEAFARGSLVPLNVPQRDWRRQFHVILHKQKYRSAVIERWLALCQKTAGQVD